MATYAAYRHIELDNVGYSKKRVSNTPSEIFNVMCTPPSKNSIKKISGNQHSPRRSFNQVDSFNRLFGANENSRITPRRASLTKQDVKNRNPVTGNGVDSWDASKKSPLKIYKERNPVTGESYTIVSPSATPTKPKQNGFSHSNGTSGSSTPTYNGNHEQPIFVPSIVTNGNTNGIITNGDA